MLDPQTCPGLKARAVRRPNWAELNPRKVSLISLAISLGITLILWFVFKLPAFIFVAAPLLPNLLSLPRKGSPMAFGFNEARKQIHQRPLVGEAWSGSSDYLRFVRRMRSVLNFVGWGSDKFVPWDDAIAVLQVPDFLTTHDALKACISEMPDEFETPPDTSQLLSKIQSHDQYETLGEMLQLLYAETRTAKADQVDESNS